MSKFRIKMKLQGLELEIEGSREDAHTITQNLGQQLAGVLKPAGAIIEGEVIQERQPAQIAQPGDQRSNGAKKIRRKRVVSLGNGEDEAIAALDWAHDSGKYGTP